jgi:HAD superfamily hydrolase (TIGR01459 family)
MKLISSIKEISDNYSHFIFDIWGVIHDGANIYPGVVETVRFLRQQEKKICFLSNAPRRSSKVAEVLKKFGITPDLYDFILTSGEATFLNLKKNQDENFKTFGQNYFYIGPQKDIDLLDGLNYQRTQKAAAAKFVINTGFEDENSKLAEKLPQMLEAKKFNLPMICVNPDLIVVKQNGVEMICAGALAAEYQRCGGEVSYFGKPFLAVYKMVCEIFGETDKTKFLAIGDGLETDIRGANDFGIDSLLISGGILVNQLGIKFWQDPNMEKLAKICDQHKSAPQFVTSNLKL